MQKRTQRHAVWRSGFHFGSGLRVFLLFGVVLLLGAGDGRAGSALRRPRQSTIEFYQDWIRFARRKGLRSVVLEDSFRKSPGEVPDSWMARTGVVLAVRSRPQDASTAPPPPSLSRILYFQKFPARGPDQTPLPGQFFLERWVQAGGAALSTFRSRERFAYISDEEVPLGDVLFALAFVLASPDRVLDCTGEVLHLASLRGGRRQNLEGLLLSRAAGESWIMKPDRRPVFEILATDAVHAGRSLVVDEALAGGSVWAGGRALPGAFTLAACQSLRATVARLEDVVGISAGRLANEPVPVGGVGSPWTRDGFLRPGELLPAGWWAPGERRVWVQLREARRDHVRGVAAWVSRARRPRQEGQEEDL